VGHVDPSTLKALVVGRYIGTRDENDLNTSQINDAFLVDIRLERQVTPTLGAYATIQNVFDTESEISHEVNGLIRLGTPRTFIGGLRLRLAGARRGFAGAGR